MLVTPAKSIVNNAHPVVNTPQLPLPGGLSADTVIGHSNVRPYIRGNRDRVWERTRYYGQSWAWEALTPGLFLKRYDQVVDCLREVLGLSACEREGALRLLRLGAHYGQVYPKVEQVCLEPGCSPATFRRVLAKLQAARLIKVVRRYLTPFRRQISNLYLFHKLLIVIARYLAEHGADFRQAFLRPFLAMTGAEFWESWLPQTASRAAPA